MKRKKNEGRSKLLCHATPRHLLTDGEARRRAEGDGEESHRPPEAQLVARLAPADLVQAPHRLDVAHQLFGQHCVGGERNESVESSPGGTGGPGHLN